MIVAVSHQEIKANIQIFKDSKQSIGFVPTMGALHDGHLSLIKQAKEQCDKVVVSIFVNPTQFDNKEDLDKYPRFLENDISYIEQYVDVLFAPTNPNEVYGATIELKEYNFGSLDNVMEGKYREGHFKGMANVVSRLLQIVEPDKAFFGKKDFQQFLIVKKLVQIDNIPTQIIGCEIIREESGLARSSRNERLERINREKASVIYYTLSYLRQFAKFYDLNVIKSIAIEMLQDIMEIEYLSFHHTETLEEIEEWSNLSELRVFFAGYIQGVRLIDNMSISK